MPLGGVLPTPYGPLWWGKYGGCVTGVSAAEDLSAIDAVVRAFFASFTSGPDSAERLEALRGLLLPTAVIVSAAAETPVSYDVDGFIEPRARLLSSGVLVDFREWVVDGRTEVFGNAAQHFCTYAKSWTQDGVAHSGRGTKSLHLVRVDGEWRISAAVWDDEREAAGTDA